MKTPIMFALALLMAAHSSASDVATSSGKIFDSEYMKRIAASHAERQLSKDRPGSTGQWSFAQDSSVGEPEALAGWVDQWRVAGEISFKSMSSQGGISSPIRKFEVTLEYKNGRIEVVGFSEK